MMSDELPNPKEVRDLLNGLLGQPVDLEMCNAWGPAAQDAATIAEFVSDTGALEAIAVLDLPLAVFTGAALGLLPAGGALDMVEERQPSAMVVDNVHEVLNILATLFNVADHPHVRLSAVHGPGGPFPPAVDHVANRPNSRLDFVVSIKGYGAGRLALVPAA